MRGGIGNGACRARNCQDRKSVYLIILPPSLGFEIIETIADNLEKRGCGMIPMAIELAGWCEMGRTMESNGTERHDLPGKNQRDNSNRVPETIRGTVAPAGDPWKCSQEHASRRHLRLNNPIRSLLSRVAPVTALPKLTK